MPAYADRAATVLLTALAPAAWGTTYVVTTALLPPGHPLFAGLMRALPAGLLGLVLTRALPQGAWWWKAGVLGALNIGVLFPLLFLAAERLPGGVAATLGATQPLLVAALAVPVLQDRPTVRRWAWGVLGVAGVGLVVLGPQARLDAVGVLAGLGGTAAMATGVVLTKRWGRPPGAGPLTLAAWQLTAGGLLLLLPALTVEGLPPRIDAGAAVGYLWLGSMGGLIAYTLWFRGIARLPVGASAPLVLLSPLVATVIGTLRGESLSPLRTAGFALALTAMLAAQLDPPKKPTKTRGSTPMSPRLTIAVLGATGMVGGRVTAEAAARGHQVLALSRKPTSEHPCVTPVPVDANDPDAVHRALAGSGADAAVLTVRTHPVDEDFLLATTRTVLDAAARLGIRVLVIGGAGALRSPGAPDVLVADNPVYVPAQWQPVAAAGVAQLRTCRTHPHTDWVYLSPPAVLEPGPRTARYRRGTTTLLTAPDGRSWISAEDLAVAAVDELETPGRDHHITVAHAAEA
ncbi:EamA family transporter [Streptomyces cyanogenus]|uniref:EamA-like transporter family protein n=1 Tax=Streptomyces cyanogenus TaxID=80860 RepID=A0ABX7TWB9_STRCY|nr:EamA-like transporter family protein [Streptomyces cyanogenus]